MGLHELVAGWLADRKVRKLLRGAPQRSLTELSEHSFAKLVGRVQPHRARVLEAPLSGRSSPTTTAARASMAIATAHRRDSGSPAARGSHW